MYAYNRVFTPVPKTEGSLKKLVPRTSLSKPTYTYFKNGYYLYRSQKAEALNNV